MNKAANLYLPENKESWPQRLNYYFGIGRFTNSNEKEALKRAKQLVKLIDRWNGQTINLKHWPHNTEEEEELKDTICGLVDEEVTEGLWSFSDYQKALFAPEGSIEKLSLAGYKEVAKEFGPSNFRLVRRRLRSHYIPAEELAEQIWATITLFPELRNTPFEPLVKNSPLANGGYLGSLLREALVDAVEEAIFDGTDHHCGHAWLYLFGSGLAYLGSNPNRFLAL